MKEQITSEQKHSPTVEREFLKYTFFKLGQEWRRLAKDEKAATKEEFANIIENFEKSNIVKTYSLIGTRGDTDFLIWNINRNLEEIQSFNSSILKSQLGAYLTTPYSYLAITRHSEYLGSHQHEGQEGLSFQKPGTAKYLFVYPFIKKREWYFIPHKERTAMMAQHFKIGHKYPLVRIHTGYSFGLDDQEFVLAFETDQPSDFSELVMELRSSDASRYTELETPIFTCLDMDVRGILNLLG